MSATTDRGRRFAAVAVATVLLLAVVELISGVTHRPPTDADWAAIRGQLDPEVPLRVGTHWRDAAARQELLPARAPASLGPPDLRGLMTVQVLGDWGPELQADLEDLPPPEVLETFQSGPLRLTTYALGGGTTLNGMIRSWDDPGFSVSAGDRPCRRVGGRFRCKRGSQQAASVGLEYAEVDYRARHCAVIRADEGETVTLEWPQLETGNMLRGHLGFHDFNGRLRSEAPVDARLWIDDELAARWTVTDAQGWAPFAVPTVPGAANVRLQLRIAAGGTWDRTTYGERKLRPICLELRTLAEEDA